MFQIKPDFFIYIGAVGVLISFFFFSFFIYKRTLWLIHKIKKKDTVSPKLVASLRNLLLILLMTSLSGMVLFMGFFFRAYQAFTHEQLVAEVFTQESQEPDTSQITLLQYSSDVPSSSDEFLIKGDQWMLEGDILKWDNWLNFLGLHTRYRLTRLRGRYIRAEDEKKKETTLFSLVEDEDHPLWRFLYTQSSRLPFVSTVYGNASYQVSGKNKHFLVYVSTSGFVIREKAPEKEGTIS